MRALFLLTALLLPVTAFARVVEKVVAVVGDEIVLQSEVEERAQPLFTEINAIPNPTQRAVRANAVRREILDRLIDEKLLQQQAGELKLSVSTEEVDRSIDEVKRTNNLDDTQLRAELQRMGMNLSDYRANIRKEIMRYRVLSIAVGSKITVSDSDVQAYYERNFKAGGNTQVRAATIFVVIPENADAAAVREKEAQAKRLLARAQAGEDFSKLAMEHSEDPATRSEGGDLGYFGKGMLPKPIEEIVFAMKVGEVRGPVRADRGFHVIKLLDRKAGEAKPLAEVKDEIREKLRQKEMERQTKNYLSELRRRTLVEVRL